MPSAWTHTIVNFLISPPAAPSLEVAKGGWYICPAAYQTSYVSWGRSAQIFLGQVARQDASGEDRSWEQPWEQQRRFEKRLSGKEAAAVAGAGTDAAGRGGESEQSVKTRPGWLYVRILFLGRLEATLSEQP